MKIEDVKIYNSKVWQDIKKAIKEEIREIEIEILSLADAKKIDVEAIMKASSRKEAYVAILNTEEEVKLTKTNTNIGI